MEGDVVTLQDLFVFDFSMGMDSNGRFKGSIKSTGLKPRFLDKLNESGIVLPNEIFEKEI
jgi:pilus assembly protein CpaF